MTTAHSPYCCNHGVRQSHAKQFVEWRPYGEGPWWPTTLPANVHPLVFGASLSAEHDVDVELRPVTNPTRKEER